MTQPSEKRPIETMYADGENRHGHLYFIHYRRRQRRRLLVAYIAPLLLLSLFFHYQYTSTMEEGIFNHIKSVAENQRNTVDLFLQERVSNLRGSLRSGGLSIPPEEGQIERVLDDLRFGSVAFVDVGLFSPDGYLVSYAGPHTFLLGKNYSGEDWFQKLRNQTKNDYMISDVFLGFRGNPHFIIAVRRLIDGQIWTLRASVDPEKFREFVVSSHMAEEAEAFIINTKGERQTISTKDASSRLKEDFSPYVASETSVLVSEADGQKKLNAIAWLNQNAWAVVVRVPSDKAFAPLQRARLILVSFTLATLILILLFVNRNTRRFVERLEASDTDKEELRRQLFNAAKLASVGEMSAGVAHEINNPLAIIHEEASMMKDMMDPQFGQTADLNDFRERLDAIVEAALRGRTITRNLLAFSRHYDPILETVDLTEIVEHVIAIKEQEFHLSDIVLNKEFSEKLPPVLVNRNQMEQVLFNLLNNALDAIGRGGRITIRTRQEGREIQVDVEDTGCGMSDEQMEKIFFPFYTTKKVGKGTGLGLSISYGIIKSFGGRIEVKSRIGEGTAFTLALPIREKDGRGTIGAERRPLT